MSNRSPQESVSVTITKFSKKGHGLGTTCDEKQRNVEVPFTIPGDTAQALLQRKRGGVFSSRLESINLPAPLRIEPKCKHFSVCGGCRWQQMPYSEQLKIKQTHIETLFRPLIKNEVPINSIFPCDPPWNYRNKMEFSFSNDAAGNAYVGLIIDGSRGKVINLTECHLVNPWFSTALAATRTWWQESGLKAYHAHSNSGSLRTLIVREGKRTGDRLIMLTVSGNPDDALTKNQLESFVTTLKNAIQPETGHLSIFLRIQQIAKGVETNFFEMLLHGPDHIKEILHIQPHLHQPATSLTFSVSPSAFFQPNTTQSEKLYSLALQLLDIPPGSIIYDLYCGTGTLGICVAKQAKQVLGIEISPESSLDARTNVKNNKLNNVTIITGSVRDVIKNLRTTKEYPDPDVVMVDPPRAGLDQETIQHLADLKPKKLLYISCNPTTQVENISALQTIGYEIVVIQPVDQFPHTIHIENIVVLSLNETQN